MVAWLLCDKFHDDTDTRIFLARWQSYNFLDARQLTFAKIGKIFVR